MFDQWKSVQHAATPKSLADAEDAYAHQVNHALMMLHEPQRQQAKEFLETLNTIRDPRVIDALERSLLRKSPVLMRDPETLRTGSMDLSKAEVTLFTAWRALLVSLFGQN